MRKRGNPAPAPAKETKQSGQYAIIPPRMFNEGIWYKLTAGEKDVYVTLRRYARYRDNSREDGYTRITLAGLRSRSGVNTRQGLRKCLVGLHEKGALYKWFKPGEFERNFLEPDSNPDTWIFYT